MLIIPFGIAAFPVLPAGEGNGICKWTQEIVISCYIKLISALENIIAIFMFISLLSRLQTAEMHSEGVNIPRGSTDSLPQGQGRWERRGLQPWGAHEYRVCPGDAQGCPGSPALEQTILASVPWSQRPWKLILAVKLTSNIKFNEQLHSLKNFWFITDLKKTLHLHTY